ncbi:MAG: ABC transporter permease [Actinomycetes bacterium]
MLTVTLRGLRSHKRRLVSTVVAVMLGVAFMAGSMVFTDTMRATLAGVFENAERDTDAVVRGESTIEAWTGTLRKPLPDSVANEVAAVPGVAGVAARVEGYAQVVRSNGEAVDDLMTGAMPTGAAWTDVDALNPFDLVTGRGPASADEIVIDRSLADEADLAVGDRTSVLTAGGPEKVRVVGVATFGDADNRAGNRTVLFTLDTAQRLLGREGNVDTIAVEAADGVAAGPLARDIEAALGGAADVITGAALTKENQGRSNEDMDFFAIFMRIFAGIALFVGAFIINNTFAILVAQRTRELALLRAIGASARQVRRSVAIEALTVGALASALGLVAGVGVAKAIGALWTSFGVTMPEGPLVVKPMSMLVAFALGVVVTLGSALLPARRAAKVAPVEAMRAGAAERTRVSKVRIGIGLVLTAGSVAAVLLGITNGEVVAVIAGAVAGFLGVATLSPLLARPVIRVLGHVLPRFAGTRGHLARENAVRNPRRTAATASALMIGVALVGAITVFANSGKWSISHSFDKEFRGDLVLQTGAWTFGGASTDLAAELESAPHVGTVVPQQLAQAKVGDDVKDLLGWPAATVEEAFDLGVSAGSLADMGMDGLAVGSRHAKDNGIELGDEIPVTFASGQTKTFVVRALFDHPDWTMPLWIDRAAFAEAVPGALDISLYVVGTDGSSRAALRESVDAVAAPYGSVDVLNRAELKQSVVDGFNSFLGVIYGLLALAIVIALIGIGNTVSLAVVERTRELGLLRAVGMSRGHMRGMVRWEAALVAVYGTLLGLGVGLFLGWSLVFAIKESGIETARTVVPVGQLALIVAIAASCGMLAALLPARRAARMDILEAVATT